MFPSICSSRCIKWLKEGTWATIGNGHHNLFQESSSFPRKFPQRKFLKRSLRLHLSSSAFSMFGCPLPAIWIINLLIHDEKLMETGLERDNFVTLCDQTKMKKSRGRKPTAVTRKPVLFWHSRHFPVIEKKAKEISQKENVPCVDLMGGRRWGRVDWHCQLSWHEVRQRKYVSKGNVVVTECCWPVFFSIFLVVAFYFPSSGLTQALSFILKYFLSYLVQSPSLSFTAVNLHSKDTLHLFLFPEEKFLNGSIFSLMSMQPEVSLTIPRFNTQTSLFHLIFLGKMCSTFMK